MNVFSLKLNLNSGVNQSELMQYLKSQQADVIQTSDGLCVKTDRNEVEMQKLLEEKQASGVTVEQIDSSNSDNLTPDVRAFIKEEYAKDTLM